MQIPDFHHIGSFQSDRLYFWSEKPLEEVWNHISRYGTDYADERLKPNKKEIDWNEHLKFAKVRIRQAIEFRNAAKSMSLITSPLPLYYSFLNLLRAYLALGPEVMPSKNHGLKFHPNNIFFESSASVTEGTFTDYLQNQGIDSKNLNRITLNDALRSIVEIDYDYRFITLDNTNVIHVHIKASFSGPVRLTFSNLQVKKFEDEWQDLFPKLKDCCRIESGQTLIHIDDTLGKDNTRLYEFVHTNFMPPLVMQGNPVWYLLPPSHPLPRAGYYFIVMFLLGSAVRYEPELLMELTNSDSKSAWILRRVVTHAERYFPQLILMSFYNSQIYFSGSVTG